MHGPIPSHAVKADVKTREICHNLRHKKQYLFSLIDAFIMAATHLGNSRTCRAINEGPLTRCWRQRSAWVPVITYDANGLHGLMQHAFSDRPFVRLHGPLSYRPLSLPLWSPLRQLQPFIRPIPFSHRTLCQPEPFLYQTDSDRPLHQTGPSVSRSSMDGNLLQWLKQKII